MNVTRYWQQLLSSLDRLNRAVKEPGWYPEDREAAYLLKDEILLKLLDERPEEVRLELLYVPYIHYSEASKDKAGRLMRADGKRHSFDYYLQQIEPSDDDVDVPEMALLEMVVMVDESRFCFHIPVRKIQNHGVEVGQLPRKQWVSSKDFHRGMLRELEELLQQS